jgi:hypothetical protein
MPQRRPPNPNTKYGRKKMREQAAYNISQYTPAQKADYNSNQVVAFFVIIAVLGIIFFIAYQTGHEKEAMNWMTR